jgi:hypothetical protein
MDKKKKLIEELIKSNLDSVKLTTNGILLKKSILNYFGEKDTLDEIICFFEKNSGENLELPINVWFIGDMVWNIHMTEEQAWWDCPNGTHYSYDGENLHPVCEFIKGKSQKIKLKKNNEVSQ